MRPYLDMQTVFAVCSALTVVSSCCMVLVYRTGRTYPGFLAWTLGCLAQGAAFTLFAYPHLFHPLFITVGGNLLFTLYPVLYHQGLRAFAGHRALTLPSVVALALSGAAAYYFSTIHPQMLWRVATVSLCLLPFYLHCAWLVWRDPAFRYPIVRPWLTGAFLVVFFWTILRLALMSLLEPERQEIWTPSLIQGATMVVVTAVSLSLALGVSVLNFQRAAAILREQERRLSLAIGATQEAIWERNVQTGQTYYSSRWFEMLGLDDQAREMAADEIWRTHCHPDDLEPARAKMRAAIESASAGPFVAEFRMRHTDGTWRWIQSRGRVMQRDAQGQPLMVSGAIADITEQVLSRERQARLEAQLHQAQKMEALGTLAGGIAHDFNNILMGILGNVQLALGELPAGSPAGPFLEHAQKASRRARDLIARIMTFSRRSEPIRRATMLAPIVEEVSALMRASLPSSILLETHVDPDCPAVFGDAAQVHEMLMNLAVNSAAAIDQRPGRIEITLRFAPPTPDQLTQHPELRPEPQLQLAVQDDGSGMSPAVAARIFEPFFTTKAPDKGSGLGLTMVHRIVADLGGAIVVNTAVGRGTLVAVFLPAAPAPNATASDANPPVVPPLAARLGTRILIVDDDPLVLRVATAAIRRIGLDVQAHERATEALEAFRLQPHVYAAILTDLTMPEMGGLEFAQEVRRLHAEVPIIIMTGHFTAESHASVPRMAHLHFLQKPFELANLQQLLNAALQAGKAGSET